MYFIHVCIIHTHYNIPLTHTSYQTHICMCVRLHAHLHNCSPLFYLGVFIRCWIIWNYSISMCLCDIVLKQFLNNNFTTFVGIYYINVTSIISVSWLAFLIKYLYKHTSLEKSYNKHTPYNFLRQRFVPCSSS